MNHSRIVRNTPSPAESSAGSFNDTHADGLVRSREAAAFLAISERKLWELQNAGEIRVVRFGRLVRFRRSDLEAWIERHTTKGASR